MLKYLSMLGLSMCIIGCAEQYGKEVSESKRFIEQMLVDPDSVKYKNIKVIHNGRVQLTGSSRIEREVKAAIEEKHDIGVCIEYNSKNRAGGYVGYKKDYCMYIKDEGALCVLTLAESTEAGARALNNEIPFSTGAVFDNEANGGWMRIELPKECN